jgi:hypothetical protein
VDLRASRKVAGTDPQLRSARRRAQRRRVAKPLLHATRRTPGHAGANKNTGAKIRSGVSYSVIAVELSA